MKKIVFTISSILLVLFLLNIVRSLIISPIYAAESAYTKCYNEKRVSLDHRESQKACACLEGSEVPNVPGINTSVREAYCQVKFSQPSGALISIQNILEGAIKLILIVAGLIAFIYLLLGGIKWITSGGDSAAVETARSQIVQALIGLIVVFAAWGIIVLFERATGICLGFTCPLSFPKFFE